MKLNEGTLKQIVQGAKKKEQTEKKRGIEFIKWNEVYLERFRIFYTNPRAIHKFILPKSHHFNKEPTIQNARNLYHDIFSFTNLKSSGQISTDKSTKINKKNKKKIGNNEQKLEFINILLSAIKNHKKLPYKTLLHHFCGLTEEANKNIVIANELSQKPLSDVNSQKNTKLNFNQLIKHYTKTEKVYKFIVIVLHKLFIKKNLLYIFGSDSNIKKLFNKIHLYIKMNRRDQISMHDILSHIKLSHSLWLKKPANNNPGRTFQYYQLQMMGKFLYWLFSSVITPLLSEFFYCTESAPHFHRIFYFRKNLWNSVDSLASHQLFSTMFEPLPKSIVNQIFSNRHFTYSNIRMLPKNYGVRPIINLGKKRIIPRNNVIISFLSLYAFF